MIIIIIIIIIIIVVVVVAALVNIIKAKNLNKLWRTLVFNNNYYEEYLLQRF